MPIKLAAYIDAVAEEIAEGSDPSLMQAAPGDVARARARHGLVAPR